KTSSSYLVRLSPQDVRKIGSSCYGNRNDRRSFLWLCSSSSSLSTDGAIGE
ncbi:unnamed protein product, partial [Linum tenue]